MVMVVDGSVVGGGGVEGSERGWVGWKVLVGVGGWWWLEIPRPFKGKP